MSLKDMIFGIEPVIARGSTYVPLNYDDVSTVLETVMGLDPAKEIEGIQFFGPTPRRIDVATKGLLVWHLKDIAQYMNESYELENGKTVLITRPYEDYTVVRVKRMPMWWDDDTVKRIFSYYGEVKNMFKEVIRGNVSDSYHGIRNGNWTLKMKIEKHMPSTLNVSGERFEIFYKGQQQTCWRCGMAHRKFDCRTKYDEFINRYSIHQFPELPVPHLVVTSDPSDTEIPSDTETVTTTAPTTPVTTTAAAPTPVTTTAAAPTPVTTTAAATPVTSTATAPPAAPPVNDFTTVPSLNTTMDTCDEASESENETNQSVTVSSVNNSVYSSNSTDIIVAAPVTTVNSLPSGPTTSVLAPLMESQTMSDSSEGYNTIQTAWEDYVEPNMIVEVHHADNSQIANSETTLTASELEDDQMITPAQRRFTPAQSLFRQEEEVGISSDQPTREEDMMTIEVDPELYESILKDEGKRALGSSDEDNSVNNIILNIGSFVNSFNPFGSKEKKRTKLDRPQSQPEPEDI